MKSGNDVSVCQMSKNSNNKMQEIKHDQEERKNELPRLGKVSQVWGISHDAREPSVVEKQKQNSPRVSLPLAW